MRHTERMSTQSSVRVRLLRILPLLLSLGVISGFAAINRPSPVPVYFEYALVENALIGAAIIQVDGQAPISLSVSPAKSFHKRRIEFPSAGTYRYSVHAQVDVLEYDARGNRRSTPITVRSEGHGEIAVRSGRTFRVFPLMRNVGGGKRYYAELR